MEFLFYIIYTPDIGLIPFRTPLNSLRGSYQDSRQRAGVAADEIHCAHPLVTRDRHRDREKIKERRKQAERPRQRAGDDKT